MLVGHLSDLHLGRSSAGDPHGAGRLSSFRQALATLADFKPAVIVIAGDTFESPHIEQPIIEGAARSFAHAKDKSGAAIPVVVIPGNHDPADADKLWTAFQKALDSSCHVRLALQPEIIELAEGKLVVEAYPCRTRFSAQPPWENLLAGRPKRGSAAHIVVAHGTLQGGPIPEGETDAYPFTQADVERLGADYLALGHFHGLYPPWPDGDECERSFCYCGTHEPDQFGSDSGYAILAEVVAGQAARLRRIPVGKRHWQLMDLHGPADLARVEDMRKTIEASQDPARFVIRIRVAANTGWTTTEIDRLELLEGALRALGAQVERRGEVQARVDTGDLDLTGLPSGAVRESLLGLQAELGQTADEGQREIVAAAIQLGWEKIRQTT